MQCLQRSQGSVIFAQILDGEHLSPRVQPCCAAAWVLNTTGEMKENVPVLPWISSSGSQTSQGFGHSWWSLALDWFLGKIQCSAALSFSSSLCHKNLNLGPLILLKQWCLTYNWILAVIFKFTLIVQDIVRTCSLSRCAVLGAGRTCSDGAMLVVASGKGWVCPAVRAPAERDGRSDLPEPDLN